MSGAENLVLQVLQLQKTGVCPELPSWAEYRYE
jgi:hypothetical protein